MEDSEKLALFLGMLSGDGCLSIAHNGEGYRDYPIQFYNNDEKRVRLFDDLFKDLFGFRGRISSRTRLGRKKIWEFQKRSVKVATYLKSLGFPEGVKRDVLRVPLKVKSGTDLEKKYFFLGVLITDGSFKKNGAIMFHMGSKLFLEDLAFLASEFTGVKKKVKEFTQRGKYRSYQLYLNKKEKEILISDCPDGTMVLR